MDDRPTDADPKPGFFKSATGLVAGATTLVAAVAGLLAAFDKLPFQRGPAPAASAKLAAPSANANSAADATEYEPTVYTGKGEDGTPISLEWSDDKWVLSDKNGTYDYEEMYSPDDSKKIAFDKLNGAYLRWPVKGGMAEEGSEAEGKKSWSEYAELTPKEDAASAQ